jgi:hypothetical protein
MFQGPVTIRNELKGLKRAETPKPSTLPGWWITLGNPKGLPSPNIPEF